MKRILLLLLATLFALPSYAQHTASNPLGADLKVQDAGTCSTTGSFAWQQLPTNAATTTVNLAGTFNATVTIRLSNNGGGSWTTNSTTTSVGTTSISTNGFTDICADVTTFTSGVVNVTISTGLNTGPQGPPGPAGGSASGNAIAPPMGYYLAPTGQCPTSSAFCFATPANTQESVLCSFAAASASVSCQTQVLYATAAVAANVVTYTFPANPPAGWVAGNSVTVTGFTGGDAFFNQTCTLSTVTTSTVTCPLVHANASSTTGPGTVTNTSVGPFTVADAGTGNPAGAKRIFGYIGSPSGSGCRTDFIGANTAITAGVLTISTFNSSLNVTMSGNSLVSSVGFTGCVIWGNLDDTAAAAMDVTMQSATQCPRAHLAAAYYMFTVPHFFNNPAACTQLPALVSSAVTAGNLIYDSGFDLDGRGKGTTTIFLTPSFPESGGCTNGLSKTALFVVPTEGHFSDFQITGGGNFTSTNFGSGCNLLEVDGPATLEHVACQNFGAGTVGTVGLAAYVWAQVTFYNNSGCGDAAFATNQVSAVTGIRVSLENPGRFGFNIGSLTDYYNQNVAQFEKYNFTCYDCFVLNQAIVNTGQDLMRVSNGKAVKLYHTRLSPYAGGLTTNSNSGYHCTGGAGCILDAEDSYFDMTGGGTATGTGSVGINCGNACTIFLKNSIAKGTSGGGLGINTVAGSIFNDLGGNTIGASSIIGSLVADGHSLKAACTGVASASSTLALISSGTSLAGGALTTACTGAVLDKGIPVNGARTLQNLICTSSATTVSVACTVMTSHNGGAFASSGVTCTMTAATSCIDGAHSLVLADGDFVTVQIVTGAAETGANIKAIAEWN